MRNKRLCLFALLALLAIVSACSQNKTATNALRLKAETAKWNSFRMEGIVQTGYQGLSLRKYFLVTKDRSRLRLDVVDGGIAGMSAQPLLSFYIADYMALKCPMMPQLELLNLDKYFPHQAFDTFNNLDSLISAHQDEILANRVMTLDGVKVDFDPSFRISTVQDSKSGAKLTFTYTRNGIPDKLEIIPEQDVSVLLLIDDFVPGPQDITPLEKPSRNQNLLQDISEKVEKLLQNLPEKPND